MKSTIIRATVILSAILIVAYIALLLIVNSARFHEWIEAEISDRTGYEVSARDMRLDPLLRLTLTEVTATRAASLALQAQRVIVIPSPAIWFSSTIHRLEVEKPVLSFDLYEFFSSTKKDSSEVSIRHLTIQDGTLVLRMGEGSEIDFRSVSLSAENVNLGEGIGVHLRTAVPWLNGVAAITVEGRGDEKEATIRLEQSAGSGLAELIQGKNRATFETKIKVKRIDDGPIRISAQGKLNGMRIADESVSGDVSASAEIKPDLKDVVFAVTADATELPAKLPLLPVPIPEGKATFSLRGNYKLAAKNLHVESLELRSPLGDATGEGQLSFAPAAAWKNFQVRLHNVAVENLKPILPSPMNTMAYGGTLEADLEIDGPWRSSSLEEALKVAGTARLQKGAFASPDGSKVGEKLTLEARVSATGIGEGNGVSLAGRVDIEQGEVLWGKFYSDLKSRRPTIEFDGEYRQQEDFLRLRRASVALASIGHVAIHGDFKELSKNPVVRVEIKSDDIQSSGFFEFFIRETLNRRYPTLDRLAVAGLISVSAKASGTLDKLDIEGALTLRGGELRAKSNNWSMGGIAIVLPFSVDYPAALANTTPAKVATGTLTIESAKFGTEVIPVIKSTVSLWDNVLRFHEPIRLPIYGGSLEIANLAWKDVIDTPQAVSLSLEAKNLQLQKLTETLNWYRFGGTLSGSIAKIEWTGESLRSQGQIDIAVFGGRLHMSQLEIENPFSPVPSIKLDARFEGIQLEQASETFAFGRISGVLAGTVNDLVVTNGQPSEFKADIYSVEERGVSQRISVESLNKITVLSSGRDAGPLYGGIAGFFDSFRYSKLGFKATLKNDKLTLRGVETRGGQEYLVVGSLIPPTVNVISHTQEIAFSELVSRVERIQKPEKAQKTAQ